MRGHTVSSRVCWRRAILARGVDCAPSVWPTGAEAASEFCRGSAPIVLATLSLCYVGHVWRRRSSALQVQGNGDWVVMRAQITRCGCRWMAVGPCRDLVPEAAIVGERHGKR